MKKEGLNYETPKQEVITDQSDPRMIEFRESYGEFRPGCTRKTFRLEITEYAPGGGQPRVTTKFGYYEGDPPPAYRQLFRKLLRDASGGRSQADSWPVFVEPDHAPPFRT